MNTNIRILMALVAGTLSACSAVAQADFKPTINVTGSAEIKVPPDEVHIAVGVETRHATLDGATQENNERVSRILSFLKKNGVKDQDIQTDYLVVEPSFSEHPTYGAFSGGAMAIDPITGLPVVKPKPDPAEDREARRAVEKSIVEPLFFVIRKSVGIRVADVSAFERIMGGLLTNGVNNVQRVDFRTSRLETLKAQARRTAVRSARENAEAMAAELGVRVGKPFNISVEDRSWWGNWPQPGKWSYAGGGGFGGGASNPGQNAADDTGATFAVGQITVTARVAVTFFIE